MNQCLRCNGQCNGTSLFCAKCEALSQSQERNAPGGPVRIGKDVSAFATSPQVAVSPVQDEGVVPDGKNDDISKRITAPNPDVRSSRISQASVYNIQTNRVEQALHRLSDAARRLAAMEPDNHRKPKNSRLSPLRDISADIRRQSTPLPSMGDQKLFAIEDEQSDDLGGSLPDLWPWLNDGDSGEIDADSWSNRTDPLISRRFPDSIEAARIEEEDMRRAAEGLATFSLPAPRKRPSRLRVVFASLILLAILALTIDSILVSFAFLNNKKHNLPISTGSPTLTLSATNVIYGQEVILHIRHFSRSSPVHVTRDMEEPISLQSSTATIGPDITVDANGNADVSMYIAPTWAPGYHTIEAEDTKTHYNASTSLRIMNAGPTRPPHLVVDTQAIDLGAEPQGANSVRPLSMHNDGSGSITWSASSDQPWLLVAPNQGSFSDSQTISVAGERANLKPGDYNGMVTISSNVGASAKVQVQMTVRPLPATGQPVLQVTPALLSFVAIDGGASPTSQSLVVSNIGSQQMHWSLSNNAPTIDSRGAFVSSIGTSTNWLSTDQTKGTVAPHATATIRVNAQSNNLLPGAYTSALVFSADRGTINSPQSVNIALTVQPRCSLQVNMNVLSFTAVSGRGNPTNQTLNLYGSSSCSGLSSWTATSSAPWLSASPTGGQLNGTASTTTAVAVNTANLKPGSYAGTLILTMTPAQSTQSVAVQLTVQQPPPPGAPVMTAAPLNLNFIAKVGQIQTQTISITNTGGSPLAWSSTFNTLVGPQKPWLLLNPIGGIIAPGGTEQVTTLVNTRGLSGGLHPGQITLNGRDANTNATAAGSPQVIPVSLNVQVPCTLSPPTSSPLAFTAAQGSTPASQTESFTATGNCAWPAGWNINSGLPSWLSVGPSSGSIAADGQPASLTVAPSTSGLAPGNYSTQLTISSTDSAAIQPAGSPQNIPVTLTVTGFTVSGTVNACADSACSSSVPLANAALTLTDGSGKQFTATADANGSYSFTDVALGACTVSASGSSGTTSYSGSTSVTVTGNQSGVTINAH